MKFITSINKIRNLLFLILPLLLLSSGNSLAGSDGFSPFVESFPNGKIDWDSGYFYGTGIGYPHMNKGSKARALKVAQAGALSAILQVASRLRVDDKQTLKDMEREKLIVQIKGLILYEPHEREFIKKGVSPHYRVTYRAPMKGVKGLTKKLLTTLKSTPSSWQNFPEKRDMGESDESLPWLVLDARGLERGSPVNPALFPKIMTEKGETVYDLRGVEEGALVERGMARYVVSDRDHDELLMLGGRPFHLMDLFSPPTVWAEEKRKRKKRGKYIITNVKQVAGLKKTNLVISEGDARDLKKEDASSKILKQCRVIVIVSSPLGGIEGKREGIRNRLSSIEYWQLKIDD